MIVNSIPEMQKGLSKGYFIENHIPPLMFYVADTSNKGRYDYNTVNEGSSDEYYYFGYATYNNLSSVETKTKLYFSPVFPMEIKVDRLYGYSAIIEPGKVYYLQHKKTSSSSNQRTVTVYDTNGNVIVTTTYGSSSVTTLHVYYEIIN